MQQERCIDLVSLLAVLAFVLCPIVFMAVQVERPDTCTYQDHEIDIRDVGTGNIYLEVNRSYCKHIKNTRASKMEDLRHLNNLRRDNCTYTPSKYYEVIYMRCTSSLYKGDVGSLYITGNGNVFCGGVEFGLVITGQNNTVYRVVSC